AADGIKNLALQQGGTTRQDIADALAAALTHKDRRLREEVLQALFQVRAPIPLAVLLDLLSDRRPLFGDYRICDNALWILQQQLGMNLEDAQGNHAGSRCTPEVEAFLDRWYDGVADRLRWDAAAQAYAVGTATGR